MKTLTDWLSDEKEAKTLLEGQSSILLRDQVLGAFSLVISEKINSGNLDFLRELTEDTEILLILREVRNECAKAFEEDEKAPILNQITNLFKTLGINLD